MLEIINGQTRPMTSLKPFSRAREFMLHVDDAVCDGGSESHFIQAATGDDVRYLDSLLVSSKSATASDQI